MLPNDRITLPKKGVPFIGTIVLLSIFINAIILKFGFIYSENLYPVLFVTLPLLAASAIYYKKQRQINSNKLPTVERLMDEQTFAA